MENSDHFTVIRTICHLFGSKAVILVQIFLNIYVEVEDFQLRAPLFRSKQTSFVKITNFYDSLVLSYAFLSQSW